MYVFFFFYLLTMEEVFFAEQVVVFSKQEIINMVDKMKYYSIFMIFYLVPNINLAIFTN